MAGEISQTPQMMPFELVNRYHLDAFDEDGQFVSSQAARWFPSKTHWCKTPYLPPHAAKEARISHPGRGERRRRAGSAGARKSPSR